MQRVSPALLWSGSRTRVKWLRPFITWVWVEISFSPVGAAIYFSNLFRPTRGEIYIAGTAFAYACDFNANCSLAAGVCGGCSWNCARFTVISRCMLHFNHRFFSFDVLSSHQRLARSSSFSSFFSFPLGIAFCAWIILLKWDLLPTTDHSKGR